MKAVSQKIPGGVRVTVTGDVDLYTSPQVRKELLAAAETRPSLIVVDLSGSNYMDSSGVATLVECLQRLDGYGGRLALVGVHGEARDVFEMARLSAAFKFYDSEAEALAAEDGPGKA
jgi:anti-sigma B factor antagonist